MEDNTNFVPGKNRILVKQDAAIDRLGKEGLLYAVQGAEDYPSYGTVLKIGNLVDRRGNTVEADVSPGDRVMFKRRPMSALIPDAREGGREEWKDMLVLHYWDDILCVVEAD